MRVSASKLRANIYSILDDALKSGIPVEVMHKGRLLRIIPEKPKSKLSGLRKRDCIVGDPEDLVHIDWHEYWTESH